LGISASIGRFTEGLLLDFALGGWWAPLTVGLQGRSGVREIFNVDLEGWYPAGNVQLTACARYLTDEQLAEEST
jgi:hypothetical protein